MDEKQKLEEIFKYYGEREDRGSQEILVEMLKEIQTVLGHIPPYLQERAAMVAGVKKTTVQCLIRRFPSLKGRAYQTVITVCKGKSCKDKGGQEVLNRLKRELKVNSEGISADGKILLRTQDCLRKCKDGPNILIDGNLYPGIHEEEIPRLIKKLRRR